MDPAVMEALEELAELAELVELASELVEDLPQVCRLKLKCLQIRICCLLRQPTHHEYLQYQRTVNFKPIEF
jgi:hypothetical protein